MTTKSYGIEDISTWLLQKGSEIELPAIQRGFVWKTSQIENLWDSIFRGYPVGSFLLSQKETHLELFDGQQRATSIALGFYNPWEQHSENKQIGSDNGSEFLNKKVKTLLNKNNIMFVHGKSCNPYS